MYKIAVIGDKDSIYGFATLGLETFPVQSPEEGARILNELAHTEYAIIYITESLQEQIRETVERYREEHLPAIIPIPGVSNNTGRGIADVKRMVEKAVGSDIIFGA
ncbi:MAG: V-type ATP synthase subunit F [Parasporobacterium sp.]|nr:V-type ATP synthase subunit F [Parasporobacterium sp.]MBQ9033011.1 V-type ATP synthase subunit F [Parasporobacterium sp.]